jgi:hypothetical protein
MDMFQCRCSGDKILGKLPILLPYPCAKASALDEARNLPFGDKAVEVQVRWNAIPLKRIVIAHLFGFQVI